MTGFKAGDRVRLTGPEWGDAFPLPDMNTVTVEDVDQDGILKFVGIEGWWYGDEDEGWGMELNPDTPAEHFKKIADLADQLGISTFEQNVRRILDGVADIVVARNKEYGNSALDPVQVFSKSGRMEQLKVQLDHKLSRIARGGDPGIDTLRDLIGYEVLYIMAMETE